MFRKCQILVGSPLLWIGTLGVVSCLAIALSGNMAVMDVALRLGIADWFPALFPGIFWATVALALSGLILGIARLRLRPKDKSSANAPR